MRPSTTYMQPKAVSTPLHRRLPFLGDSGGGLIYAPGLSRDARGSLLTACFRCKPSARWVFDVVSWGSCTSPVWLFVRSMQACVPLVLMCILTLGRLNAVVYSF